jgi:ABC-type transport system substrate-binding protein
MPSNHRLYRKESSTSPDRELDSLIQVLKSGAPEVSRRDLMRISALAAGAVVTARTGIAAAAPSSTRSLTERFQDEEIETDVTITVPFDPYGQPVTLDPHRTANWGPFWVMFPNVWSGLLRYDENGAVILDLADSVNVSDDGLVYTFAIRPDAQFASGNQVTANAFVSSWQRALTPGNLSPMASFMTLVEGYSDYVQGESDEIGFAAIDDLTVQITLSRAATFFPSYLASFVWSVVDPAALEEFGDEEFALNGAGTGPWQFTEFDPSVQLVMEPNPNYYGGNSPSLSRIVWPFITGPTAASMALEMYREDEAVSADVPLSLKTEVEEDDELSEELVRISPEGSVRAIGLDFNQEPFNDVRVRRAVAHAIDRDLWASNFWEGTWAPGSSFTPPVLAEIANYEAPAGIEFDPDQARSLLEQAGYPEGEGLPEIVYYQPAEDSESDKARMQALLLMIRDNSGIEIRHEIGLTTQQIADIHADAGGRQFDILWWWNIYETPRMLNELASPDSPYMRGVFNWSEELEPSGDLDPGADAGAFEALADDADVESDEGVRNSLYRDAEELMLQNAVYIPLGYWIQMFVQKPYLQGTRQGPWTGRLPVLFDSEVVVVRQ